MSILPLLSIAPPLSSTSLLAAPNPWRTPCSLRLTATIAVPFPPPLAAKRGAMVVSASPGGDAPGTAGGSAEPVEGLSLPLESKLQEVTEQRLRMRLAKKTRLRRKRLVRKRHLRKKGRWPPSKMRKNKNV